MQIKIVLILWEQAILRKADAEPTLFWRINCNKGWRGKRKSTAQDAAGSPTQIRANALPRSGYYCIFILQRNWFFKRKGEWTLLTACKHFSWIFLYLYFSPFWWWLVSTGSYFSLNFWKGHTGGKRRKWIREMERSSVR